MTVPMQRQCESFAWLRAGPTAGRPRLVRAAAAAMAPWHGDARAAAGSRPTPGPGRFPAYKFACKMLKMIPKLSR